MTNFVVLNGSVRFDDDCENTRPFCGAVCCRNTIVLLTEEEKEGKKYDYVTPTDGCNCSSCQTMRAKNAVALRRKDTGCVYLDGVSKCSIYEDRPKMCRDYPCKSMWWQLSAPSRPKEFVPGAPNV